jgi:hypothetical protein
MVLHQIEKHLQIKGNNCQNKKTTHIMGENHCCSSDKGLISRMQEEFKNKPLKEQIVQ